MDGSETRPYTTLGLDGSETRPYTTIRDPSLHGQDCAPTGLKCGKWDIARKVESDRPSRARRSGRNKNDLATRLEWAAEKLREANSLRLREKVPTLSQRTRKN